jgi:hypothetical protein
MLTGPPPKFHGTRDILEPMSLEFHSRSTGSAYVCDRRAESAEVIPN